MLRAIVYDAVGTLIHVKPSVAELYAQVGRRFGSQLTVDVIQRRFPAAFARQERVDRDLHWRTDETRERQRWRDIVAEVLDDVADKEACFETLFDCFGKADAWSCDPGAESVISAMQQRGLIQAVASNFDARLHGLLDTMPGLSGLAPIVISSQVGWRKPAAAFFEHLATTLRLPTEDILFVGDDRTNDFEAARQAGMRALLIDSANQHRDVVERIGALSELLSNKNEFTTSWHTIPIV